MSIWDFTDYSYDELLERREHKEEIGEYEKDEIDELNAEIKRREERGYQFVLTYETCNNDTYENMIQTILLYEIPKDVKKIVGDTYDGVWEPDIKSIKIYKLENVPFVK